MKGRGGGGKGGERERGGGRGEGGGAEGEERMRKGGEVGSTAGGEEEAGSEP